MGFLEVRPFSWNLSIANNVGNLYFHVLWHNIFNHFGRTLHTISYFWQQFFGPKLSCHVPLQVYWITFFFVNLPYLYHSIFSSQRNYFSNDQMAGLPKLVGVILPKLCRNKPIKLYLNAGVLKPIWMLSRVVFLSFSASI